MRLIQLAANFLLSASLGYLAGYFGAYLQATIPWPKFTPGDWGTWVGAIGTCIAFAATIWIATSDRRIRRRSESDLARVTAAAFMIRLQHARSALKEICQELNDEQKVGHGSLNYPSMASYIRARSSWSTAEVVPLITLPGHSAAKLAMVQAVLAHVCLILELSERDRRIEDVEIRWALSQEATGLLGIAIEAITVAWNNCRQYAQVAALGDIPFEDIQQHVNPR